MSFRRFQAYSTIQRKQPPLGTPRVSTTPRISVMLVDDDPAFLKITQRLLEMRYGDLIKISATASSGEECLALAQTQTPDVVLLDLHMPGIGGLGTIPLLHVLFPQLRIIALTSDDSVRAKRMVLAAGGHELVGKSAVSTDLFPAIQRALAEDLAALPA